MARTDEGEFELVLGNRQLISVFLIVVILLSVFFSMGYIVGRNSAPAVSTEAANGGGKTIVVDRPTTQPATTPPTNPPQETPAGSSEVKPQTTHPEQPAPPSTTPAAPHKEKPAASPPSAPASTTADIAPGEYWQVVATARPDAEIISEALAKKGFHASLAPAPKDGMFRVLVGPLKDAAAQAQTRTELEASGFKNPIMRKY